MIRSADNDKLKTIRKLQQKRWRQKLGLFAAEGEDLVEAAERAGWPAEYVLRADVDVEPELLAAVSALGSGSRVIGVYRQRWAEPGGSLGVWLHEVEDPGNIGTIIRSTHALADGPVILGPGCGSLVPEGRARQHGLDLRPPAGPGRTRGAARPALGAQRARYADAARGRAGAAARDLPGRRAQRAAR
jgi:tRNA G18 (ribose-2'-O)-methylase SpoU